MVLAFLLLLLPLSLSAQSDFTLTVFVHAQRLDYSNIVTLCHSIKRCGNVGHAWIALEGGLNGKKRRWVGGHSGELGRKQPKYAEGIMQLFEAGHPDPVSYLWTNLQDGFLQRGSGGHLPTYTATFELSQQQYLNILDYIREYPYWNYSLTANQCVLFVTRILALAGYEMDHQITVKIAPSIYFDGRLIHLWSDPRYAQITFASPDILERSLRAITTKAF